MLDLARYLLVCALFVSAGAGLIRLLRVRLEPAVALLLGSSVTQALLAVTIGISVVGGRPLKQMAIPVWGVLLALAAYGVRWWLAERSRPRADRAADHRWGLTLLGVSLLAAPLVMVPYFVYGLGEYPGSGMLDGWAYSALGQYLWEFRRDTEGGLAPLYQWAMHLGHTRFASAGQLALLSVLYVPGDTQWPNGLMRAVSIFSMASACAAYARARRLALPLACLYVCVAAISGWALGVLLANNFDHGLALQYFPALATLAISLSSMSLTGGILTGIVAAAAIHTYAEFSLLAIATAGFLGLEEMIRRRVYSVWWRGIVALAVAAALAAPYWHDFSGFIRNQIASGLQLTGRPGAGLFLGLLDPQLRLSSLFALGGESLVTDYARPATVLAGCVLMILVIGMGRLLWQRQFGVPLVIIGFGAMVWALVWQQAYAYGAYKVLSLGWWLVAFAMISGVAWLPDALGRARRVAWTLVCLLALATPAVTCARAIAEAAHAGAERMSDYRAIERLPEFLGREPVVLSVFDVPAEHWGTYYLRRTDMLLGIRNAYLAAPHLVAVIDRAQRVPPSRVRFVVTDSTPVAEAMRAPGWRLVWAVGRYAVWDTASQGWAVVTNTHSSQGYEVMLRPFFHAGPPGSVLHLLASRDGTIALSTRLFNAFVPTDQSCWGLNVAIGPGPATPAATAGDIMLRPGTLKLELPVSAGVSTLSLIARPTHPSAWSVTAEAAREGSLADTTLDLLPIGAAGTNGLHDQPAASTACDPAS